MTTSETQPRVAVICVTHDSARLLQPFMEAIRAGSGPGSAARVVVVDSGSTDETVSQARCLLDAEDVVLLEGNRGYAAGINRGLEHVRRSGGADVVVVMNPDVCIS